MMGQGEPAAHSGFVRRARSIPARRLLDLAESRGKKLLLCGEPAFNPPKQASIPSWVSCKLADVYTFYTFCCAFSAAACLTHLTLCIDQQLAMDETWIFLPLDVTQHRRSRALIAHLTLCMIQQPIMDET